MGKRGNLLSPAFQPRVYCYDPSQNMWIPFCIWGTKKANLMTNVTWADPRAFRTRDREISGSYKPGAQHSFHPPPPTFRRRGNEARKQFQKAWGGLQQGSQGTQASAGSLPLCHLCSVEGSMKVFFRSAIFYTVALRPWDLQLSFYHTPSVSPSLSFLWVFQKPGGLEGCLSSFLLHPLPVVSYRLQLTPGSTGNVTKVTPNPRAQMSLLEDGWKATGSKQSRLNESHSWFSLPCHPLPIWPAATGEAPWSPLFSLQAWVTLHQWARFSYNAFVLIWAALLSFFWGLVMLTKTNVIICT